MNAARLELSGITKSYGGRRVLDDLDLAAEPREVLALLGPSGSGKSTALRIAAGVEQPDAGDIRLDGRSVRTLPAHTRGIGLMFQDGALFPHLDVGRNVAYGLRMAGATAAQRRARVAEILALVGLPGAERREVDGLSGGEAQRVALARTLAPRPPVALLDEPLASLDRPLRLRLQADLPSILRAAGTTVLFVTHDQEEAFSLADRVAVMATGRIEQVGTPREVYGAPATEFVARFVGSSSAVRGTVKASDGEWAHAETAFGLVCGRAAGALVAPDACVVDVSPAAGLDGTGPRTALSGNVTAVRFLGPTAEVTLAAGDEVVTVLRASIEAIPTGSTQLLISAAGVRILPHVASGDGRS